MEIFVMLIHLLKIKIFPKINKIVLLKFQKKKKKRHIFSLICFHVNLRRKEKNITSKMTVK